MKILQISEEKALELYKNGSDELKTVLEESFGKEFFPRKITDRIKTYEDACVELGITPINEDKLIELGYTKREIIYQKLTTIVKSLNEGWTPDLCNNNEIRWYPQFKQSGTPSLEFVVAFYAYIDAVARGESHLCLKSKELSDYCGKQFIDLWREFIFFNEKFDSDITNFCTKISDVPIK